MVIIIISKQTGIKISEFLGIPVKYIKGDSMAMILFVAVIIGGLLFSFLSQT